MSIFNKIDGYFLTVLLGCSGGIAFAAQINERIQMTSDTQHVPAMYMQHTETTTLTLFSDMCAEISYGNAKEFGLLTTAEVEEVADLVTQVCNTKKSVAELTPAEQLPVVTFSKAI